MDRYRNKPAAIAALVRDTEVHRDCYIDPEVFALEMQHLFANTWVYVGHASQVPNKGDFYTTTVGTEPVVMVRHTSPRPWSSIAAVTSGSSVAAAPSASSISRLPDTVPQTTPMPGVAPTMARVSRRSGRRVCQRFQSTAGRFDPSAAAGSTAQPASCSARAASRIVTCPARS